MGEQPKKGGLKKYAAFGLIVALFLVVAFGLLNYFEAIFAAFVFAPVFSPLYRWVKRRVKKRSLAAALTLILILILLIGPLSLLGIALFKETTQLYNQYTLAVNQNGIVLPTEFQDVGNELIAYGIQSLRKALINIIGSLTEVAVKLFIMFFLLYFLLLHEEQGEALLKTWLPFTKEHNLHFMENFKRTSKGFIMGQGLVALIQGFAGAVGFVIFGLEGALFFGFAMAILSLLPLIGAAFIWLPIGILQLLLGETWSGVGILIWGAIVVSNIDNFVRPVIMRNMIGVHPVVTILGIFSGLAVFGLVGFVIGPLFLTLAIEAAKMFKKEWYG